MIPAMILLTSEKKNVRHPDTHSSAYNTYRLIYTAGVSAWVIIDSTMPAFTNTVVSSIWGALGVALTAFRSQQCNGKLFLASPSAPSVRSPCIVGRIGEAVQGCRLHLFMSLTWFINLTTEEGVLLAACLVDCLFAWFFSCDHQGFQHRPALEHVDFPRGSYLKFLKVPYLFKKKFLNFSTGSSKLIMPNMWSQEVVTALLGDAWQIPQFNA